MNQPLGYCCLQPVVSPRVSFSKRLPALGIRFCTDTRDREAGARQARKSPAKLWQPPPLPWDYFPKHARHDPPPLPDPSKARRLDWAPAQITKTGPSSNNKCVLDCQEKNLHKRRHSHACTSMYGLSRSLCLGT